MKDILKFSFLLFMFLGVLASCGDDEDILPIDEEWKEQNTNAFLTRSFDETNFQRLDSESGDGYILRNALKQVAGEYDFCIIDNAPVLNIKTVISLLACHNVIIPMRADNFSRQGLHTLLEQINHVKTDNKNLYIKGVLFTHYQNDDVNNQCIKVISQENKKVNVFKTKIRFNRHIMESTFSARPLADISSRYGATMDYKKLTKEYLKCSS